METIYKYPLALTVEQFVDLPFGAQLLDVQDQNGQLTLWARVDTTKALWKHRVVIAGTGRPIHHNLNGALLVRTVQQGAAVWHVFILSAPL